MYESICIVGERGQITIPKLIRDIEGISDRDQLLIKIEDNKIVIEKRESKKNQDTLIEGYKKTAKLSRDITKEFENSEKEANRFLDDY